MDYVRRCTGGTNTCSGITDGVTACDGTETGGATACIHGGERQKVSTTISTCTGISMTDTLGVFDWNCELVGGAATFYSQLKSNKGLIDLITPGTTYGSWKDNAVTLTNGTASVSTTASAWWTNLIRAAPDNSALCTADAEATPAWTCPGVQNVAKLDLAGTIYTVTNNTQTRGYNLAANKVALVNDSSTHHLVGKLSGNNCASTTMSTAGANALCLIAAGSVKFVWVEGSYGGDPAVATVPDYGLGLAAVRFARVHNAKFSNVNARAIWLSEDVDYSRFDQIRVTGSGAYGIMLYPTTTGNFGNIFWNIHSSGGGNDNLNLYGDNDYNVFSNLIIHNGASMGLYLRGNNFSGDANMKMNIFTRATLANNTAAGLKVDDAGGAIADQLFHNVAVAGNGATAYAVELTGAGTGTVGRTTMSHLAISRNVNASGGLRHDTTDNSKFTGNLFVGNNSGAACSVAAGASPGITGACAAANASDQNFVNTGVDASGSFVLEALSDSTNGAEDANGESMGNAIATAADYFQFDNFYRAWGGDNGAAWPAAGKNGICNDSAVGCQIFDFSLLAAASVIRNTTSTSSGTISTNTTPSASACPAAAAGSVYLTSQTYTYDAAYFSGYNGLETAGGDSDGICEAGETCVQRYLANAVEIIDDLSGDDDGLCETGERCIYTPNFGAYQGHGTLTECTFTAGTITGVTMYYYPTNGY